MKHIKGFIKFNESIDSISIDDLLEGTGIVFKPNTYKSISNYEVDISGLTGFVSGNEDGIVSIKLFDSIDELEEYNNELIYVLDYEEEDLLSSIIIDDKLTGSKLSLNEEYVLNIHSISIPVSTLQSWIQELDHQEMDRNIQISVKRKIEEYLNNELMRESVINDKKIIVKFSNGDDFQIPAKIIADQRTKYYAGNDGFIKGSKEWDEEFENSMNDDELYDWIQNDTNWDDIKDFAIKLDAHDIDYDHLWASAEFEIK